MPRHRGFLYGLAMMAISAIMANRADAGSITLDVDLNGTVIYSTTSSTPDMTIAANTALLNAALSGAHSAYQFRSLVASSNYTGGADGVLQVTGSIVETATGNTSATLSIDTFQSGFLAPTGPSGTATHSLTGTLGGNSSTSGSLTSWGNANGVTPISMFSTGTLSGSNSPFSSPQPPVPVPVGAVASGYALSTHDLITLNHNTTNVLGLTSTTTLSAIPEPASLTLLLTGLPMPLVLVGLLRRRKAKA